MTLTFCRVRASRRSGEGSYKCSTCFRGEGVFAAPAYPAVVSGILTVECQIFAVLGGRHVGGWYLPWARVSLCRIGWSLEATDDRTTIAPGSLPKIRTENPSLRARRSLRFPMRKRNSRSRWVCGDCEREHTLTSVMALGYWVLFGG